MPFTDSGLDCEIRKNLRERLTKAARATPSAARAVGQFNGHQNVAGDLLCAARAESKPLVPSQSRRRLSKSHAATPSAPCLAKATRPRLLPPA
jgi:hypothetical protein